MYGTGARVTEVVRLRFSDVNLRMSFVTLRDSNDESRIVPLGKYARAAMTEYFDKAYDELKGGEHEDDQIISAQRGNHPARSDAMDCVAVNQILKQGRSEGNADHCRPANSAEGKTPSAEWEARPAVFAEPVQRFGAVLHGTLADDPEPEPEQKEEQAPGQDRPVGKVFLKELHGSITSRGIVYQITEERATDFFFFSKKHCIQSTFPIK
jgi:hypothetical protein